MKKTIIPSGGIERGLVVAKPDKQIGIDSLGLLQLAIAVAADGYRAEVNLRNNNDGRKTAVEIVAAAVAASLLSDLPDAGKSLGSGETEKLIEREIFERVKDEKQAVVLVGESLRRRQDLKVGARRAVSELTALPFPRANRDNAFVLGIDREGVRAAKDALREFETIPDVSSLAGLIKLKAERERVLPPNAGAILGRVMPDAKPETLERMTPTHFDQAMVTRGAAAGIIGRIVGEEVDWLALPYEKLDALAAKVAGKDLGENLRIAELLTAQLALPAEIDDPSASLYTAYLEQVRKLCEIWERMAASQTATGIRRFQAMEKVFEGLPLTPNLLATWCLDQKNLEEAARAAREKREVINHPWMGSPLKVNEYTLPSPEIISSLASALNRGEEARHPHWWRLKEAQRYLAEYEAQIRSGEKIESLLLALEDRAPELVEAVRQRTMDLTAPQPLTFEEARGALEGGRPIKKEELAAVLAAIQRMNESKIQIRDLDRVSRRISAMRKNLDRDTRNRAALRDVAAAAKINDPETLARVAAAEAKRIEIERAELLKKDLSRRDKMARQAWPDFLLRQKMNKSSEQLEGAAEIDSAMTLVREWRQYLMSETGETIFPDGLFPDLNQTTVDNFLRFKTRLLPDESKSKQKKESKRIAQAERTFSKDIHQPNEWARLWIMEELDARYAGLTSRRNILARVSELDQTLALMERLKSGQAAAGDIDGLENQYEDNRRKSGRVSVKQWRVMTILPIEVREQPQKFKGDLEKARKLIALREGIDHISFLIPEKEGLERTLANERIRFAAETNEDKSSGKDDKLLLPSGRTRNPKSDTWKSLIDALKEAYKTANPFVPVEEAAGATLAELVNAAKERVQVAEAAMAIPDLEKTQQALQAEKEQIRLKRQEIERLARGRQIVLEIRDLTKKLKEAPGRLLEGMKVLGLAIETKKLERITNQT